METQNNFRIIVDGQGELTNFYSDAAPPRVGEVVNFFGFGKIKGDYKVLKVTHRYLKSESDPPEAFAVYEILVQPV